MNFDDYNVTIPYPEKPRKPMMGKITPENARKWADELEAWQKELEEWNGKMDEYKRACNDLQQKFKEDVLRENGLEGHPKAEKVYYMAWSEGHCNGEGYGGVANWVEKLAELVKD